MIRKNIMDGVLPTGKKERQYEKAELTEQEQEVYFKFLRDAPKYRYQHPFFIVGFGTVQDAELERYLLCAGEMWIQRKRLYQLQKR